MTKAMTEDTAPAITGIHHLSVTVRDIEASAAWYQRLFRAERVPMKLPHYEREELDAWIVWLEELGIEHSAIRTGDEPFPYATVVFRDPDNIQLELFTVC